MQIRPVILAFAGMLGACSAHAADVRYPRSGKPSISFAVPAGWTIKQDGRDKIVVVAPKPDPEVMFTASFVHSGEPAAQVAEEAIRAQKAAAPLGNYDWQFGNYKGTVYYSRMADDPSSFLRIIVIPLDAKNTVLCTMATQLRNMVPTVVAMNSLIDSIRPDAP